MGSREASWVRLSDLFPATVDLRFAAGQLQVSMSTAYRWMRGNKFPCPAIKVGRSYVIEMKDLMRSLGIQDIRIRWSHVQAGIDFAREVDRGMESY